VLSVNQPKLIDEFQLNLVSVAVAIIVVEREITGSLSYGTALCVVDKNYIPR
jgi:hypothetical protein